MIRHLKTARLEQGATTDPAVTATVERLIAEVEAEGDAAVLAAVGPVRRP